MKNQKVLSILVLATLAITVCTFAYAGSVRGFVKYDGEVPKFKEIKMDADPICLSKHSEKIFPQTLVLNEENKGMANVFVYVKGGIFDQKFTSPVEPVVISQEGCMYDPHVVGIMVGQPLKILNTDGTLHNVHALSKVNAEFNLAMPKFRRETTKTFDKAEFMFPIKCDVHPWMSGWIAVMDNPFFAVTDEDGSFSFSGLPYGQFELVAWHEKLGTKSQTIHMLEGGVLEVDFSFSRP